MREIDRLFLTIFKDLRIEIDDLHPGTDDKPNCICYLGKVTISSKDVVRLVKQYQDLVIEYLTESNKGE